MFIFIRVKKIEKRKKFLDFLIDINIGNSSTTIVSGCAKISSHDHAYP